MTPSLDPGKTTPTKPPYLGDDKAQEIRAVLKRLRNGTGGTATATSSEETTP